MPVASIVRAAAIFRLGPTATILSSLIATSPVKGAASPV